VSVFAIAVPCLAGPIGGTEDFNNFGKQGNFCTTTNPGGVCFAASAINSFIYLENQFPGIYGNSLTPNIAGAKPNQTDMTDATTLSNTSGPITDDTAGWNLFLQTKTNWVNTKAPGTTVITSEYAGSPNNNAIPDINFLLQEIQDHEDVEMFISGGGIAHAIDLVSIGCTVQNGCTMQYQDPNFPTTLQPLTQLTAGPGGFLTFTGLPGFPQNTFYTIDAVFSESPVPEPSAWILTAAALAAITFRARRRTQ